MLFAKKDSEIALEVGGFIAKAGVEEIKLEQIQTKTAGEEPKALYQHDIEIGKGASQWMINLRASVRPVVTYIFVLELVAINIAGVWYAYNTGVPFAAAMAEVFSDDEMLILSSIIAFWFGTQAFGKK